MPDKGGTGKTTTTAHLGVALSEQGHDVLLIDLAGKQGDLAKHFGIWGQYRDQIDADEAWPNISTVFDDAWNTIAGKLGDDAVADLVIATDEDFEFRMAHLQYRDGDWYLHASMRKVEADEGTSEPESRLRTVLDVDLGVNNLAVASTGRFWSADEFNHWRREYKKRRGSLQQCESRQAHENIESVGQKEYGRFEIYLHSVANELIEEAVENDCSHIVFEDLTHIRETVPEASWQHVWAFRRLSEYVEYKAKEHSIEAVQVDPRNTSKRCSTCGVTHDDNRSSESFECQQCGYENQADYNASKNIGLQHLRRRQNADDGGAPADVRLNRGMLNVSGEYVPPASTEAWNGSPRESLGA